VVAIMTEVIAWPPFQLTGWELAEVYPQSRSVGLIEGRSRTSSAQRARRVATANVTGIGTDLAGAGYVRMLNRMWAGGPQLVRVQARSALWWLYQGQYDLRADILEWTDGGTELLWTAGSAGLLWNEGEYALSGEPSTDGGWHSLTVTGLPPSRIVARPSEIISVTDGVSTEAAYALRVTRSDAAGRATIRTDKASAFTLSGLVGIGNRENIVFEAVSVPRTVQGLSGSFGFQWDFREVFEDEYADGWSEVDPWD
jgi:hypothetical protein